MTRIASFLLVCVAAASAEVRLPAILGDGMVLQRDRVVAVWGWANPREAVTVRFLEQERAAVADDEGRWRVEIGPFDPALDEVLVVEASNRIERTGVCVGEVWICSGQSNMAWQVRAAQNAAGEIESAGDEGLRLFTVGPSIATEPRPDVKGAWARCGKESVRGFSAVGYFFGRHLRRELKVPVGLIHSSWGGTPAEAWTSLAALETRPELARILQRWKEILERWPEEEQRYRDRLEQWQRDGRSKRRPRPPLGPLSPHMRAGLFNGMIAPLVPYGIRGAIWYQGESNAGRAAEYRVLFPTMIRDWRGRWGQGDFPFLFVQLANFKERRAEPGESSWAELREAQRLTLGEPRTGMAVAIDLGEARDIHPRNKQEVGRRLALEALRVAYGRRLVSCGPLYGEAKRKGHRMVIHFDGVGGGLKTSDGQPVRGFAIAGRAQKWRWAQARIDGETVVVWHPRLKAPKAVRYAWADNPDGNLVNAEGLPSSPFRTDDWPLTTAGR